MGGFRALISYKKSFALAMAIFDLTKKNPKEEKYSLTDQIRRSSRSVVANLSEAYRKRDSPAYFKSELTEFGGKNLKAQVWLEFAFACKYIADYAFEKLTQDSECIGRLIVHMINNPEKFGVKKWANS